MENAAGLGASWRPHTVIGVKITNPVVETLSEKSHFTLVSDVGIVQYNVPVSQMRGLDSLLIEKSATLATRERIERAFGADSIFQNRTPLRRAFLFVPSRREIVDTRRIPHCIDAPRAGILKRTWSALSPVEAMNPLELSLYSDGCKERSAFCCSGPWRCLIGEKKGYYSI